MKNLKNKFILASAILALASCADNSYLGDQEEKTSAGGGAISFGSNNPSITRAEDATSAKKLDYTFQVYGTKTVSSTTSNVFATNVYDGTSNTPYWAWFNSNTANTTNSNSAGWEYVGVKDEVKNLPDSKTFTIPSTQTIKYWDNSASQYDFVAFKANAVGETPAAAQITNVTTSGFTVSATPAQLAALYIADKKVIVKNTDAFGKEVEFTFRNAATKVRLGIYETVPGYSVRNIKFYYTPKNSTETSSYASSSAASHATLTGKFVGASNSNAISFAVTYEGNPLKAVIKPSNTATVNTEHFDFGTIGSSDASELGTTSTSPTWAGGSADYISVFPNTDANNIANMTLKVDYDLYNSGSGEVINVTGKTAVVPAAYMTWKPNYAYTYLFKITDDQLTPITLDAVVVEDGEGNQETITTVTEPSITTYSEASNVISDNEYKENANIFATVMENNSVVIPRLSENVKVYYVTTTNATNFPITELSLATAIKNNTGTTGEIKYKDITSITVDPTVNTEIYFTAVPSVSDNKVKLTGVKTISAADTYYAIEYTKVEYVAATGTYVSGTKYYTDSTGATTVDTSGFTSGSTDVSSYFVAQPVSPAVKAYKVIKIKYVASNP
jgi:hypothetical protein